MKNEFGMVLIIAAAVVSMGSGCVYSMKSAGVLSEGIKNSDRGIVVDVNVCHDYSCIYPPETIVVREIFHTQSDVVEMLCEPILRLPTLPLELIFNAFAIDVHKIRSKAGLGISNSLKESARFDNDEVKNESVIIFNNGKKHHLPFLVETDYLKHDKFPNEPIMRVLYGDTDGWLWFGGHIGSERLWGMYRGTPSNCPNNMVLCKVSSKTGEVVPVLLRDDDRIFLAPGQTDFVELKDAHRRKYFFFQGLSRFFMQSSL